MSRSLSLIATALLFQGVASADAAQNGGQTTTDVGAKKATDGSISGLIKQLGDDSFERREEAGKRLAAIGEPALKLLQKAALEGKDAEIRERADSLAQRIRQQLSFFISLEPKSNVKLAETLGNLPENSLINLPKGLNAYAKKWFKVEDGVIQLSGTRIKATRPIKVEAIKVNRELARLHFLHVTSCGGQGKAGDPNFVADGTLIGQYTIHFADQTKIIIPIEYGNDLRDCNNQDNSRPVTRGNVGWTGANPAFSSVRLYVTSWENLKPAKRIATIEYQSMNTLCSPFCVAISAERAAHEVTVENPSAVVAWRFREQPETVWLTDALVMDDLVIVGNRSGYLRALRTQDAKEIWSHKHADGIISRPICDKEHIYFSSSSGVAAVSRENGKMQWSHPIPNGVGSCFALDAKGLVFAGGYDGFIYALSAKTGELQWKANIVDDAPPDPPGFPRQRALPNGAARPEGIACDGETLFQNVFDQSRVVAVDVATGKLRWSYQTGGWVGAAPGVSNDYVLVGSQDKFLHCIDKRTGKMIWKFSTAHRNGSTPVIEKQKVFFASDNGGLYCVNLVDGKQLWKFETEPDYSGRRFIYSTPILTHETLYFAAGEGTVYALNKEKGTLKWKLRVGEFSHTYSSLATDDRRLFVTTRPDWDNRGESSLVAITLK